MENKKHIVAITAIVKYEDKFLITKRNSNEIVYPGKWTIPGGKLEKGELIINTLKREVKEEVSLDIKNKKEFIRNYTFIRLDGYNVIRLTFLVTTINNVKLSNELEDFKWIFPRELKEYNCIEGIKKDIKKAFSYNF